MSGGVFVLEDQIARRVIDPFHKRVDLGVMLLRKVAHLILLEVV